MGYLLDTNVISELRKGSRADTHVRRWFSELESETLWLSALTVGELRRGIESIRRRDSRSAARLETWLMKVLAAYGDRVLPVDGHVAEEWGRMNVPDPLPVVEGLLAATARVHGLVLATRNVRNVEAAGVAVLDPFAEP